VTSGPVAATPLVLLNRLPPANGATETTQLRHKGNGVPHLWSKQRDDLFIEVEVDIPKKSDLSREQQDLLFLFQELEEQKKKRYF
jgi:DnaJ-class molecular chaperone